MVEGEGEEGGVGEEADELAVVVDVEDAEDGVRV